MKIEINTNCKEDLDKVIYYLKNFCEEQFQEYKLHIDGELKGEKKLENGV